MKKIDTKQKLITITCPHCGREYLPAEIYLPNSFFGHPENIEKDSNGKIDTFEGPTMDLNESFKCDNCDGRFEIVAQIKFNTYIDQKKDFSKDYSTPVYPSRISLFEG